MNETITMAKLKDFYNDYQRFIGKQLKMIRLNEKDWNEYKKLITPPDFKGKERKILFFSGVKITKRNDKKFL